MTDLLTIAKKYKTDKNKSSYCDFYDSLFKDKRNSITSVCELGVYMGGSLLMWEEYFPNAIIYGIDRSTPTKYLKSFNRARIKYIQANCTDPNIKEACGVDQFDFILDDASHKTADQQKSFFNLFKLVKPGGLYIIEDAHTSFMPKYINTHPTTYHLFKYTDKELIHSDIESVYIYERLPPPKLSECSIVITKRS